MRYRTAAGPRCARLEVVSGTGSTSPQSEGPFFNSHESNLCQLLLDLKIFIAG